MMQHTFLKERLSSLGAWAKTLNSTVASSAAKVRFETQTADAMVIADSTHPDSVGQMQPCQ